MSHGAMPDAAAHVTDEDKPRKNHSGPRKRRPKKKPNSRSPNAPTTPEQHTNAIASTLNDTPESTGLCAAAASFTPPSKPIHSLVTPPLAPVLAPETEIHFNPLNPAGSGSYSRPQASRPATSRLFRHPELSPEERAVIRGEQEQQAAERAYWTQWVIEAAEKERARRLNVLKQLQCEEEEEIRRRRQWAIATIEKEQEAMMREMFLDNMKNTQWFQSTISRFSEDYEVVCPNSWFGCTFSCMLKDLESHLERCVYRQVPDTLDQVVEDTTTDFYSYDVVCPNAVLGCKEICSRENLAEHLANCPVNGMSREKEWEERLEWRRSVIQASEKERERRIDEERAEGGAHGTGLSFGNLQRLYEEQTAVMQVVLHDEIVDFYNHHRREARDKRLWMQKAIGMVTEEIELLWNHCVQVEGYGSFATRLHGESSDVDLVVFGATEEFNFTSQQCVEALADHVRELSAYVDVSAITRASIPLLKVVVLVTIDGVELRIPFDITFDEPHGIHHNGVASVTLVQGLASAFYGLRELTLVLKHFLVERGLNDPYVGGLSSYGLLLMVVYVLQEQGALISMVDGQKLVHDAEDDLDEMKPVASTRWHPRYEAQCLKGELIAKEIVKQCSAKQQPKKNEMKKHKKKAKRAVLPSFVTGLEEHETKPYLLGKLLMDFLQFYGNDFRQNLDQVSVVSWGEPTMLSVDTSPLVRSMSPALSPSTRSPTVGRSRSNSPLMLAPPLSRDGLLVIEDPLQPDNNVGKSCYRVSQVFRDFSDFLSFLTALIVRGSVMTTGKKKGDTNGHSSPPSSTSSSHEPTCRILTSVFQMKTREKRASLDLREQTTTTQSAS
ncbi:hypothetical protein PC129_g12225 [Phytophthora cactorum]|uniref:Poly(A) RNA polymerase mitochondrial-like central palm domain-containing protein n=2 Tax=Phytophthora cactorum TaxID=29920 RepID=A0A8T1HXT0_9STRA|nr:hypothetical protein Pcac1_g11893 [Phytophthora cactorum]KAG2823510.1 hypothetical protein PC111_g10194 [Phytophthora cactorum]KAG2892290.1 hypothetical protein PC114_g16690 [Phytophthora cactorum]KAG2953016.1 hypothetical protein PC117_g2317 [Phytophthora cactorum]KAG2979926.1 hypothetical protein PC118_g11490 [Phytophthora cactorum]